jgi:hypothetical protein
MGRTQTDVTGGDRSDEQGGADRPVAGVGGATPGDVLRSLPGEARRRGTRFVSAQAMQAKLFSVYDAAAAAEDALALVQEQLTLTLNRNYYEADEIESMAAQLDALLALESLELPDGSDLLGDLVSED